MMEVEPGTLIAGKYRVVRVLGRGGMGVVLEARHDELDQHVAVKLMASHAAKNVEWAARFAREARLAARIKSEHVVRVYDVGKLESGEPYMVMEFLEGEDVQALLDRTRRLPIARAVEYVLQACEALAEAHAAGIVHRDLKPANLFLTARADGSPSVKVLDFGISKVTSEIQGVTVTNTSAIVGSPLYMSPEQMRASKNVDARTDIWSLGVMLQQLVTGVPPFDANTAPELCALVLTAPPSRMIDTLPTVPPGLEDVVHRCLEKDATKRFTSVADLALALGPFAEGTAKVSIDRIVRVMARAPVASLPAVTDPLPAQRVSIGAIDATDVSEVSDTMASDPLPAVSPALTQKAVGSGPALPPQGPTLVSAGNTARSPGDGPRSAPEVAATQAQGPLDLTAPSPSPSLHSPPQAAAVSSTAAAWGGSPHVVEPRRTWLWLGATVAALAIVGGAAFALSRTRTSDGVARPTSATVATVATSVVPTSNGVGSGAPVANPDAGAAAIDVGALPKASAAPTAAPARPPYANAGAKPPVTKPSATTKPTTDTTSEFGGRK